MVTFARIDMIKLLENESIDILTFDRSNSDVEFPIDKFNYQLLFRKEFPFHNDCRTTGEKIMDDVKYFINRHSYEDDGYYDYEKDLCIFPIEAIFQCVHDAADLDQMRTIILKEFVINAQDCVEYKLPVETQSESSDDEDENENDNNKENISDNPTTSQAQDDEDDWN